MAIVEHQSIGPSAIPPTTCNRPARRAQFDLNLFECIKSLDALPGVRTAWGAMTAAAPFPAIAADADRFEAALLGSNDTCSPHVVRIGPKNENWAMIIARSDRRSVRCRVGYIRIPTPRLRTISIVHGGVMTNGRMDGTLAVVEYLKYLRNSRAFDQIVVNKISTDHPVFAAVAGMSGAVQREIRPHWITDLVPGSFDATMEIHGPKHRSRLRRKEKALYKHFDGDVVLRRITTSEEMPALLQAVNDIYPLTYKAALENNPPTSRENVAVMQHAAARGRLLSYVMYGRGQPIAYQIGAISGKWFHAENRAYLPDLRRLGPGTVMLMRTFRDLCENGFEVFDWGFGDAEDKRVYGTRHWHEANINIYGRTLAAALTKAVDLGCEGAKAAGRACLSPHMKVRIRTLWRKSKETKMQENDSE